ncbi:hypothetical protein Q7P37_007454 [Cladosporium fusiforme]
MDSAFDVPDSTDWLNTPLAALADLENALHCQICKEFYDTPMITSCSHTFCSRCIRTSLSADGRCPACRASDQASKLRNNWQLQEVVSTFVAARPQAIKIAKEEQEKTANPTKAGKRKHAILESDDMEQPGRTTRSKTRRTFASQSSQPETIEVEDSEDDGTFMPVQPKDDGLVECPLGCGKRMKIEAVEPHLDKCEDEKAATKRSKSRTPVGGFGSLRASPREMPRPQDRISELNYSLLKEGAMRKKMDELGLPSFGSKQLMVRRHTEWVNLWNANCDSSRSRTKRELLHDLDTWERTQGGRAPVSSQGTAIMRKDFDGTGWANKNKDDFSRLIADARRKKTTPTPAPESGKQSSGEEPASSETEKADGQASSLPTHDDHATKGQPDPTTTIPAESIAQLSSQMEMHDHSNQPERPPMSLQSSSGPTNDAENSAQPAMHMGSHDYHLNQQNGQQPCELPSHLAASSVKKVPMFAVSNGFIRDVDHTGSGEQG